MIKRIPDPSGKFVQSNQSEIAGNMLATFNNDLTISRGVLRTTRMLQTTSQAVNANLSSYPVGFRFFSSKVWTAAGSRAHNNDGTDNGAFTVDAGAGSPTDLSSTLSDIEVFNGSLYITGANTINKRTTGGTWSVNGTTFTSSAVTHMMCAYNQRLYFLNEPSIIYSMDTSDVVTTSSDYSLALGVGAITPVFMRASYNRIWIGGISFYKGKGVIHEWDGAKSTTVRDYRIQAQGAIACVIFNDIPYVMDTNGALLEFTGSSFKEIARLPIDRKYLKNPLSATNNRFIHPNGMSVVDGKIQMLINNEVYDSTGSILETCPSGVWEYDPAIGLYHKYSLSYTPINTTQVTDYGQIRLSGVGALSDMKIDDNTSDANGNILVGATVFTNASSTDAGIFTNDTLDTTQKSATFLTPWILAEPKNITETWQKILTVHKRFRTDTDKIVAKYRFNKVSPTEVTITWTSLTTFTTTGNIDGYLAGDEVEVTQGKGAGMCAHLTVDPVLNAGTYTCTVDETFPNVSGTAKARFQKWIKIVPTDDENTWMEYLETAIGNGSSRIQAKFWMRFTGENEVASFNILSAPEKQIK